MTLHFRLTIYRVLRETAHIVGGVAPFYAATGMAAGYENTEDIFAEMLFSRGPYRTDRHGRKARLIFFTFESRFRQSNGLVKEPLKNAMQNAQATETLPTPPRGCTFSESDWRALAPFWYPVAFSHEVTDKPFAAKLLDERVVIFRANGKIAIARDLCLHRGAPLSSGRVENGEIVCGYHGFRYNSEGQCVCIPAHPGAAIPPKLKVQTFPVQERYGLIWTRLVDNGPAPFPVLNEWDDPNYLQVLPNSVELDASAGRQIEGFLDVSHFAFVHIGTFGELDNREVPSYPVELTSAGFRADYISTVSNYSAGFKHLNPPGFKWRRLFETWLPFTAKLIVFFPNDGQLHILNAAMPVSARKTRVFVPICRNFDKDAPLQPTLDFNHQVFAEDKAIVEKQFPEDLPINLQEEVHIRADKSSITYRQGLAKLGLGRSFTA